MGNICVRIRINGIVQGVGFRPFLHRLMEQYHLAGHIRNTGTGVELEAEGFKESIDAFIAAIRRNAPVLAMIDSIDYEKQPLKGFRGIRIERSSASEKKNTLISPDVATCPDCLQELFDPNDRRRRYPFINCTNCGPRFSIIRDVPYDRCSTTMSGFEMCADCVDEYENISDRRYHAQPDCCPVCGPQLFYVDKDGCRTDADPIILASEELKKGGIIAVKGLGGIHLACRFDDVEAVCELRNRKRRDEKPFAVMFRNIEAVKSHCFVDSNEAEMLSGHIRPIVLLKKKDTASLRHLSENNYLGAMLPYTPVHHLLLDAIDCDLVMTSANISDLPIITGNEEAQKELAGVADGFLLNNRAIENRCDDSLLWMLDGREYPVRRSRGFAPLPLRLREGRGGSLACGAEQKASFCLSRGGQVFPSAHIGDLKNAETLAHYEKQISLYMRLFDVQPERIICDLHPDYLSTDYAQKRAKDDGIELIQVQHHHAHMAACMADNDLDGDCIGIIWDGTGYGADGSIWGGEFLTGSFGSFDRAGTLRPLKLPGGDRAIHEIRRIGIALLADAGIDPAGFFPGKYTAAIQAMIRAGLNCPESHGMGRLFDAVCAILGIKHTVSYEGQGAVLLEAAADEDCNESYPFDISFENSMYILDTRAIVRAVCDDAHTGLKPGRIAARFMNTLVHAAKEICCRIRKVNGLNRVVLSGGVFQNMYLLKRITEALEVESFEVFRHCRVSTNDEGISFGQIAIAERGGGIDVSCGTAENSRN